jgi:hypothetical protein
MMGCDPIIFVGMDLAFTDMKAYTQGVVENAAAQGQDADPRALRKIDIHGKPVDTLWKWIAEAKWIGDFAKNNPDRALINATEGGLGFPGVPNKTLNQVTKKYLHRTYRLQSRIHKHIQKGAMPQAAKRKIIQAEKDLFESLSRCKTHLQILLEENNRTRREIKRKNKIEHLQTGKGALAETELFEEPAFLYVLRIFNEVASRVLRRDSRKLDDPNNKMSEVEKTLARLDLDSKRYAFLQNVVTVNRELLKGRPAAGF